MNQGKESLGHEDLRKICLQRASFYRFLVRAFKTEVDVAFLYITGGLQPKIAYLASFQSKGEFVEGARLLDELAREIKAIKTNQERDALLTNLAVEYVSMFLAMGKKPVFLTESANRTVEHVNYGSYFWKVKDAYQSLGFEKAKDFTEPEDHISVEFDFMAQLCSWTETSLEKNDFEYATRYLKLQKEFLDDHLTQWAFGVCDGIRAATQSTFYLALAYLTNGFLTMEVSLVALLESQLVALRKTLPQMQPQSGQS